MTTILDTILARKREEVAALLAATNLESLRARALGAPAVPSFAAALRAPGGPHLIAEVKKASPSKGVIRADFDPLAIAAAYERGGAAALSVLTDRDFFQGRLDYIPAIRAAVSLPVLRKDFIVDPAQIYEARAVGASAILLIAAALDADTMASLHAEALAVGLDVLVEIHDEEDLATVDASGAPVTLLGVNNRDLRTFAVDLATTERLAGRIGDRGVVLVAESGIFTPEHVARVARAGAGAILVGESLMRCADVEAATRALLAPAESAT